MVCRDCVSHICLAARAQHLQRSIPLVRVYSSQLQAISACRVGAAALAFPPTAWFMYRAARIGIPASSYPAIRLNHFVGLYADSKAGSTPLKPQPIMDLSRRKQPPPPEPEPPKPPPKWRVLLGNLASGAIAGCAVEAALYPLDTIKTRMQMMRSGGGLKALLKSGGGKSLYAGIGCDSAACL